MATSKFHFTVEYVPGKTNVITDFLSRNPLWDQDTGQGPMVEDDFGRTVPLQAHVHSAQLLHRYEEWILSDPMLEDMRDAGCLDESYTAVIKAIREGKTKSDVSDMPDNN